MTPQEFLAEKPGEEYCQGWLYAELRYPTWGEEAIRLVKTYMLENGWRAVPADYQGKVLTDRDIKELKSGL